MIHEHPLGTARFRRPKAGAPLLAAAAILIVAVGSACVTPYQPGFDYLSVLASSPPYAAGTDPAFPGFGYQGADSSELRDLRAAYSLDEVAGVGPAFERASRIMFWLNDVTVQGGSLPRPRKALSLIAASRDSGAALNCLGMSICLAECLLAEGIPARTLTLYPKEPSDECHVVVIAWIPEWARWVYMDPSYDTVVTDSPDGAPLSPLEIRQALVSGISLAVSPGAGWNGGDFDLDYFHYLSKNFYFFYSPAQSAVGWEDRLSKKRLHLVPIGSEANAGWALVLGDRSSNSPESFFAAPE
jgi:hypothetical protein